MSYLGNEPLLGYNNRDLFAGNGVQTTFTLSRTAAGNVGLIVAVSGVVQDPTMYSVVGTSLVFEEAPPAPTPSNVNNIDVTFLGKQPTPITVNWNVPVGTNSGSTSALIVAPSPSIASLTDNLLVQIVMPTPSTTTTPTLNLSGLGVRNIVNFDNSALASGQLFGTIELRYDLTATNWKLISSQSTPSTSRIFSINGTVAANALTCTLNPCVLDFRSATLTSGAVNTRFVSSALSLVIPSTATLGTISAIQSRLVLIALDNAGTVELAVVNIAGGTNLNETGVISTTAISAAASSATVVYSTTARSNVPFRVVGYIESTQTTAGTWATAPSTLQGYGGQAIGSMSGIGYGQTWQNVSGSRAIATTYYNTTGKPIYVLATLTIDVIGNSAIATLNGFNINGTSAYIGSAVSNLSFIVPLGQAYSVSISSGGGSINGWLELR